jgi:nicotinamidase-related amidase
MESTSQLPIPAHFDPARVDRVWKVPYGELAGSAPAWRQQHGVTPASEDDTQVLLIAVDMQNTFCLPEFELFVGGRSGRGAVEDVRRLCEFIYRNLGRITAIAPTMDTHRAMQIFHPIYWIDTEGRHPEPYTLISQDDVRSGRWRVNPEVAESLRGGDADWLQREAEHYVRVLARSGGKYELTIWPYHAMLGGIGNALVSSLEEAIFFHTVARSSQADLQVKGDNPFTENYSVLKPEVLTGPDREAIARKNERFIAELLAYDLVVLAGEAKSHCLAWTIDDLLTVIAGQDPSLVRKVYILEDCASAVVVPGVIDYTEQADAAFRRFAEAGMHVVRSTEPMDTWPDFSRG